jgi:uncharacterized RDD family membrane protein YckC/predicted Ser/Thr protein kinase
MAQAEIACTCGHRFVVADDGNGAPHPCPRCQVQNMLPRTVRSAGGGGAATAVRHTAVLSPVAAAHQSAVLGLPQGAMLGPYRVERRVGKGGMGSVYEAHDERSGQRVAIKVLSPELASEPDFVARFHRESKALGGLSDRRIARVYFSGAAEGVPFFAMEFVDGRNLEQILEEEGPYDVKRAIAWMREIALGLESAAERGIIHRDVKPTNVLIDQRGAVRIVDFGLAKAMNSDTRLTVTGAVVGTPFYLSPEQGLGKRVDQRSDIYSLGASFYHLLTKKPPFEADNSVSIILKHVHDKPTPIRDLAPKCSESLARIIMRCLAKDPRHRYQDYQELIADLDAAARGDPVAAPTESAAFRRAPTFVVMDDLEDGARVLKAAGRLRRALALAIDAVLVLTLVGLSRHVALAGFELSWIAIPFALVYFAWGDGSGGQSIGKRCFRLRVARPDGASAGALRSIARGVLLAPLALATFQAAGMLAPSIAGLCRLVEKLGLASGTSLEKVTGAIDLEIRIILVLAAIDVAWSLFNLRGQTLHDALSGTAVFREEAIKRRKKPRVPRERPMPPLVPLLASVVPGFGQLVNGEMGKGLLFFIGISMGLGWGVLPGVVIWAIAAYDAHRTAEARVARWRTQNPESD